MSEKKNMLEVQRRELEAEINETRKLWSASQKSEEELKCEIEEAQRKVEELKRLFMETHNENVLYRMKYEKLLFDKQDVERAISKL